MPTSPQKQSGERRLLGKGGVCAQAKDKRAHGRKPESFPGFSERKTKQHDFYSFSGVIDEKKNTQEYTSFYYVKYIPSMAVTCTKKTKDRADCRALFRLTKSSSPQVLSTYCSGAVASQEITQLQ